MTQVNPRIVFAADIFIREIKRQWMRQHPSANPADCPVGILEEYPPQQRIALVTAIGKAIEASTGMDETYLAWIQLKTATQQPV